jgi:hypothetical protein
MFHPMLPMNTQAICGYNLTPEQRAEVKRLYPTWTERGIDAAMWEDVKTINLSLAVDPPEHRPEAITVSRAIWDAVRAGQPVNAERAEELDRLRDVTVYLDERLGAREWYEGSQRPGA